MSSAFINEKLEVNIMAEIKDCVGKEIKISKCSITIKSEEGKTCGVIRDIRKFKDIQPNKASGYFHLLRKCGAWGNRNFNIDNCIEKDGKLYVFRNIKGKIFHEKYGYFTEDEIRNAEEQENIYNALKDARIDVIECVFV